jgi:glycosyltransferase involved in cell wall biosynthesis
MRILQVSASDRMGGAEKIARTLHEGSRAAGHASRMAVGRKTTSDPDVALLDHDSSRNPWAKLCRAAASALGPIENVKGIKRVQLLLKDNLGQPRRAAARRRGEEDFDFPATADLLAHQVDLLHLHNLHSPAGYFDLHLLPALSRKFPTILTLHDAWPLAGHCAHSIGCERWLTGCGQCPDLSIYPSIPRDATAFNWRRKRDLYAQSRLRVCTPSRWLMEKVERSILAPAVAESRVIPNGVDLATFHPADPRAARAALDLPQDAKILLFAANGIRNNVFKDYRTMRDAIARVAHDHETSFSRDPKGSATTPELIFLALGETAPAEQLSAHATLRFVPFQPDERAVARFYQAADGYLHPARADTFPTTVLEALACGKPVVATAVGGIPEQVTENETGHLTPSGDAAALADAIVSLLNDDDRRGQMSIRAAEVARNRFDARDFIEAHLAWYAHILSPENAQRTTDA